MPRPEINRDRSMLRRALRLVLPALAVVILLTASEASAQYEGRTYAITDARLVTTAGQVIENGTIVMRGGLIEALGADVTPPADAVLIDGEGHAEHIQRRSGRGPRDPCARIRGS